MTKYFFTGGTMPSADLLLHFQDDLALQRQWNINGKQYSRTLEAWLSRQDSHRSAIMPIMKVCTATSAYCASFQTCRAPYLNPAVMLPGNIRNSWYRMRNILGEW